MKKLLFVFIVFFTNAAISSSIENVDLSGNWYNPSDENRKPIRFIKFQDTFQFTGQEKFFFEDGSLSHSIDQTVKLKFKSPADLVGEVDVFDSRGCSYKDFPVVGEVHNKNEVTLILTYPRYRVVKITTGPTNPYYRNIYCTNSYGYEYICGRERVKPNVRYECELLEKVEVPVLIRRSRF
jgi:hypothetical protein